MTAGESITAIVPVHNRADLLGRLLSTARAQTLPFQEVVVVDNGSTDAAMTVARSSGCRVVEVGRNSGFAHAVNLGWQSVSTDWVAILNTDVELEPEWLERLTRAAGDADFATGTLLQFSDPSVLDGSYDLLSRAGCAWRAGHGARAAQSGVTVPIVLAPATACLFRRDVLNTLGGLDETFGSYLEDVDLGMRCLRAGFRGVYVPDAVARHHGSATYGRWNPRVVRLISRNQLMLIRRHYDPALFRACLWPILVGQMLWGLLALRHGAFGAWFAGKLEGLRGFSPAGPPSPAIRDFLIASESEIRVRALGDFYWRWYFRIAGAAAH